MDYIAYGEAALNVHDYGKARKYFGYARRANPEDWRAWYGLTRVITKHFTVHTGENWKLFFETAIRLCPETEKGWMIDTYNRYLEVSSTYLAIKRNNRNI